jgi:hypothetical protein
MSEPTTSSWLRKKPRLTVRCIQTIDTGLVVLSTDTAGLIPPLSGTLSQPSTLMTNNVRTTLDLAIGFSSMCLSGCLSPLHRSRLPSRETERESEHFNHFRAAHSLQAFLNILSAINNRLAPTGLSTKVSIRLSTSSSSQSTMEQLLSSYMARICARYNPTINSSLRPIASPHPLQCGLALADCLLG